MARSSTIGAAFALVASTAALAAPAHAQTQTGSATVQGTANIFAALGNSPAAPGGGGAGTAPTLIALDAGTGRTLSFSTVTGTWSCGPGTVGADGGGCAGGGYTDVGSAGSIAGIQSDTRNMFLVGVFLGGSLPAAAPSRLTYSAAALDAPSFGPLQLGQVFFIGDGQGTGGAQAFAVPDAATQLFLGVADAFAFDGDPGFYDDNSGSVTARYEIAGSVAAVPEPSSLALAATGLAAVAGMGAWRRRRG